MVVEFETQRNQSEIEVSFSEPGGREEFISDEPQATSVPAMGGGGHGGGDGGGGGGGPSVVRFRDDTSMHTRSSTVRFRGSNLVVLEQETSQMIMEETVTDEKGGRRVHDITIKVVDDDTFSHLALRSVYTMVSVFFGGFLFIFCVKILLFIFMDIAALATKMMSPLRLGLALTSTILSIPVTVHGLSSTVTFATAFVMDTWRGHGHRLQRWVGGEGDRSKVTVASEWVSFIVYVAVPAITAIVTLFMGLERWWAYTLLSWFSSVFVFWAVFSGFVFYDEISTCLNLVREMEGQGPESTYLALIKTAIHVVQKQRWSGSRTNTYIVNSGQLQRTQSRSTQSTRRRSTYVAAGIKPVRETTTLFARVSLWFSRAETDEEGGGGGGGCCKCFTELDVPEPMLSFQDLKGSNPIITRRTWSLEKFYCRNHAENSIAIVRGKNAVTLEQKRSSLWCMVLGNMFLILAFSGLLWWLQMPVMGLLVLMLSILLCCIPNFRTLMSKYRSSRDMDVEGGGGDEEECDTLDDDGNVADDSAVYRVSERLRITRPSEFLCFFTFWFGMVFFTLWPLIALFVIGNYFGGLIFLIFCIFSNARRYLNAIVVLKELGTLEALDSCVRKHYAVGHRCANQREADNRQWMAKSRFLEILERIGRGQSRDVWRSVFWGLAVVFGAMAASAVLFSPKQNSYIGELEANFRTFQYEARPGLSFPTCELKKGFQLSDAVDSSDSLSDVVYMAATVYNDPAFHQEFLDGWYTKGKAENQREIMDEFQDTNFPSSPMRYMLTTFPDEPGLGVVTVRGTVNILDMFTDAQLWAGATLLQLLRFVLPLSSLWTPVLNHLTAMMMTLVETSSLKDHAYYKEVRAFIEYLQSRDDFDRIVVLGHSLGGGVAMIAGAQAGARAVGVSGPNAMLSRDSFDPPISKQDLNELTFNIIPDRDIVPMMDDRAQNFQEIECRADRRSVFACHDVVRSLCDIQYHCGSGQRPALCSCHMKFNYPAPTPIGNETRTFEEACLEEFPNFFLN